MDIEEIIGRLRNFKNFPFPILSVYLGSQDKKIPYPSFFLTQLHGLVHQNLDPQEQKYWQQDLARIEKYLQQSLDRKGNRSLAFFSSQNLWQALELPFFLPPFCKSSHSVHIDPIEDKLEENPRYLLLLVDREKARMFIINLGKVEQSREIFDNQVPQRVKAKTVNLGRTDKIMRHIEYHLNEHLKLIAKSAKEFISRKKIHFIIIGGHKELFGKIKKSLPYPLNRMVLGEFVTELNVVQSQLIFWANSLIPIINKSAETTRGVITGPIQATGIRKYTSISQRLAGQPNRSFKNK